MNSDEKTNANFWSKSLRAKFYRIFAKKQYSKMHEKIANIIGNYNVQSVLDMACGPGDLLLYLSNCQKQIKLYGTDIAPGMVEHAKEKLGTRATITQAEGNTQPFPDNSFDVICITMAFHHFPNKPKAFTEIRRLLKPNGLLLIGDVVAKSNFQKRLWNILERITAVKGFIEHYTASDIQTLSEQAGFSLQIQPIEGMAPRYKLCILRKK